MPLKASTRTCFLAGALTVSFFAAGLASAGLESGVGGAGLAVDSGVVAGAGAGCAAGASGALSWPTAGAKKGMLVAIAMHPSQFRGKLGFQFLRNILRETDMSDTL